MSDHVDADRQDRMGDSGSTPETPEEVYSVESYEVENGVVFYDAENPLAWLEATATVLLHEFA